MDIAVVVNLRARRGSPAVASRCRSALPGANVVASRSLEEAIDFARAIKEAPPELLLAGGGDGTAIALVNALREHAPETLGGSKMVLGVLPLGTGNAWARAMGARDWKNALDRLGGAAIAGNPLPRRRFDLVEVLGTLAHFAGTGWDAEMIDDFHAQKTAPSILPPSRRHGLAGYLNGMFTRTIPRHVRKPRTEVELINTGEPAMTVDREGRPIPVPCGGRGVVLYRGPMSVCAAGTTQEWGMGFRAFPFAGLVPGRMCMRIYAGGAIEATLRMAQLWRGKHPTPKMHTWLLTACKVRFSEPVPFQIGGDRHGHRTEVDYAVAPERVDLLDWRRLH